MQLHLSDQQLQIHLTWYEQLLAFHFGNPIQVPLQHIQQVSQARPDFSFAKIRAPGTSIPGIIRAGTYYGHQEREFWYVTSRDHFLCLELTDDDDYRRIILSDDRAEQWAAELEAAIASFHPYP